MRSCRVSTPWALSLALVVLLLLPTATAHAGGEPGSAGDWEPSPPSEDIRLPRGESPCPNDVPERRAAQVVEGVAVLESPHCRPDDPRLVAAFVKGTDQMPEETLNDLALHRDAVKKSDDRDGDGDPDVIEITLEVSELNGWHLEDDDLAESFDIGPGIHPPFWVFSPKSTVHHSGDRFFDLVRLPSPPIRIEQNDTLRITIENTHHFPHTLHLHGIDHPFLDAQGEGNDGVPHASEDPIRPGESRTYELQPRQPGTMFYHCHVQPHVHVMMGLAATIVVEEQRANNTLQTLNVGGGLVRHPSQAIREQYDAEHDLVYQDLDLDLNLRAAVSNDPREVAELMNRDYDVAGREFEMFLLNGRVFPYTLRESTIVVEPDQRVKLRIVNAGETPIALHTHGHKPVATHWDGVPLNAPVQRDVHWIAAAQRTDLDLVTTDDGLHSFGPGVWFMHDHQEQAVTTNGIGPGGDITVVVYREHLDNETNMPKTYGHPWDLFFIEQYYQGDIPVWHALDLDSFLGKIQTDDATEEEDATGLAPAALLITLAGLAARRRRAHR